MTLKNEIKEKGKKGQRISTMKGLKASFLSDKQLFMDDMWWS